MGEARTRIEAAMLEVIRGHMLRLTENEAEVDIVAPVAVVGAMDAVLACRTDERCERCAGSGQTGYPFGSAPWDHEKFKCPDCGGTGSVPGPPAVLELVAEQVGAGVHFAEDHAWMLVVGDVPVRGGQSQ